MAKYIIYHLVTWVFYLAEGKERWSTQTNADCRRETTYKCGVELHHFSSSVTHLFWETIGIFHTTERDERKWRLFEDNRSCCFRRENHVKMVLCEGQERRAANLNANVGETGFLVSHWLSFSGRRIINTPSWAEIFFKLSSSRALAQRQRAGAAVTSAQWCFETNANMPTFVVL